MASTGTYINDTDVKNVFGSTNVIRWSNLEGGSTENETRTLAAIRNGEEEVENRLRGRFAIPLSGSGGVPYKVKDWMARLAGVWLYESRGQRDARQDEESNRVRFHRRQVHGEIDQVLAGQIHLALSESQTRPTAPVVVRHG